MNPKHVHTPVSTRARCPVCREVVYSRGGIHPQCAVRQYEPAKPKPTPPEPSATTEPVVAKAPKFAKAVNVKK